MHFLWMARAIKISLKLPHTPPFKCTPPYKKRGLDVSSMSGYSRSRCFFQSSYPFNPVERALFSSGIRLRWWRSNKPVRILSSSQLPILLDENSLAQILCFQVLGFIVGEQTNPCEWRKKNYQRYYCKTS